MSGDQTETPPDIRPLVAKPGGNRTVWVFAAFLGVAATALFASLENRRATITSPAIAPSRDDRAAMIARPPELAIPLAYRYPIELEAAAAPVETGPVETGPVAAPAPAPPQPRPASATQASRGMPPMDMVPSPASVTPMGPSVAWQAPPLAPTRGDTENGSKTEARVEASRLRNPSTTVAQGAVIQAVLETALDSTRPGFVRAVVSLDVMSFDGTRVLIPKGSKLFGEYKADLSFGQKRAMIQWHRLTRPDGAIIDVDSPSADALGRAGVKGKVNSHFFQRFSGAILQSVLDIGVNLATRKVAGDNVIVALPGSAQGVTIQKPDDIRPTLKVGQGSSVSVFVGRDLDFTAVET